MSDDQTKTGQIEVHLSEIRRDLSERLSRIESDVKIVPVLVERVNHHEEDMKEVKAEIKHIDSDINKAKGWAGAIGAAAGFIASLLGGKH